jgi:cellulose synthase (UDP-forming)
MLACIERPRENRPQREFAEGAELIINDGRVAAWISELGPEQARVRGPTGLVLGAVGAVEICGVGAVGATIIQEMQDGYKLRLTPAPEQRRRIISKLHTHAAIPGTAHGNLALVVKQLARSLTMS